MLQIGYSLNIILRHSTAIGEEHLKSEFIKAMHHLYSHSIFKNILDLVATKSSLGQLQFRVQDAKFFDIDAGSCVTMVDEIGYVDSLKRRKKYIITIKKIASDVIMHEIGHMLEHELQSILNLPQFVSMLMYEVNNAPIYMKSTVQSLFIEQLKGYNQSHHISELFARFFQFFAGANEIAYQSSVGARYKLNDAVSVFSKTLQILDAQLKNSWNDFIDPQIAIDSMKYSNHIQPKERWSDNRIKASNVGTTTSSRWKVKSNKEDPFQ